MTETELKSLANRYRRLLQEATDIVLQLKEEGYLLHYNNRNFPIMDVRGLDYNDFTFNKTIPAVVERL